MIFVGFWGIVIVVVIVRDYNCCVSYFASDSSVGTLMPMALAAAMSRATASFFPSTVRRSRSSNKASWEEEEAEELPSSGAQYVVYLGVCVWEGWVGGNSTTFNRTGEPHSTGRVVWHDIEWSGMEGNGRGGREREWSGVVWSGGVWGTCGGRGACLPR